MMMELLPAGVEKFIANVSQMEDVERVLLYGSRARGEEAARSDFDIAVDAPLLSEQNWQKILLMVEDAETLYKIDCVWLQKTDGILKNNILKDAKILSQK